MVKEDRNTKDKYPMSTSAQQTGFSHYPDGTILAALDIGTTKICALIAIVENGQPTIIGIGQTKSEGLHRGVVVNIQKTVHSIQTALEEAQQQAGTQVTELITGIAGDHIETIQTMSLVSISNPDHEISESDIARLLSEARKIPLSNDRKILHVIPQEYIIDGQDGIIDPIGMSGIRMEAKILLVTALITAVENIFRCIDRAGYNVVNLVLEPIASGLAVLTPEEKEVGVALVDIGGGTTDIAVFESNILRYASVIGIAGNQVTDDIRRAFGILSSQAEKLKCEHGHTFRDTLNDNSTIFLPGIGGRAPMELKRSLLTDIIQPRMEEILEFVLAELIRSTYAENLPAGVVFTGGGSLLPGLEELAHQILKMPVRIGFPRNINTQGLAQEVYYPQYATSIGLLIYALQHPSPADSSTLISAVKKNLTHSIFQTMKRFFEEL